MATTFFNYAVIEAARRLGDIRTDATPAGDTGRTYSSAVLSSYGNLAVKKLILDSYNSLGPRVFMQMFPELVKRMAGTPSAGNILTKPTDCYTFVDLYDVTGNRPLQKLTDSFERVMQQDMPLKTMSFYETQKTVVTSPDISATATLRGNYIMSPVNVTVNNLPSGGGGGKNYSVGTTGSWVASTRTLSVPSLSAGWVAADVGKLVVFFHSAGPAVYHGHIESVTTTTSVVLTGDNLPTSNLTTVIGHVYMADGAQDVNDLPVDKRWLPVIIDMMVEMALKDATASIDIG